VPRPKAGLYVEKNEGPKQVDGRHHGQEKGRDRRGLMAVDVVGMPDGPHLPKSLIFNQPAIMSELDDPPGRGLLGREGRRPDPIRTHRLRHLGPLATNGSGFLRSDHPNRPAQGRPGGQALQVPGLPDQRAFRLDSRPLETEKSLGILKKIPAVVFEDDQDVLAVAKTKPDERGAQVQAVGDDKVEGPGIVPNEAAQKPEGAAHLVFPFPLELDVQKKRNPAADEQSGHETMIKLQTPVRGLTLRAAGAAAEERGGGFVPVEDENRPVQGFIAFQPLIETSQQTPQESVVQKGEDPADGIGTGKGTLETAAPERVALVLLQGMETAQAGQDHEKGRGKDGPRRNDGPATRIGQGRKKALNPVATFGIGQKATENRLPLLFSLF